MLQFLFYALYTAVLNQAITLKHFAECADKYFCLSHYEKPLVFEVR